MTQSLMRLAVGACCSTALTVSLTCIAQPVRAMTFNQIEIGGLARVEGAEGGMGSFANLNFSEIPIPDFTTSEGDTFVFPSGVFENGNPAQAVITDLAQLEQVFNNPMPGIGQVRMSWERDYGANPLTWLETPEWDFKLTRFILHRSAHSIDPNSNVTTDDFTGDIFGYFELNDGTRLDLTPTGNELTAAARLDFALSPNGTSYQATLRSESIPTPALLPGVTALGIGVWRKRKARRG